MPPERRTPAQELLARQAELSFQFTPARIEKAVPREDRPLYEALKKKLAALEKGMLNVPQTWGFYSPESPTKVAVLPMKGFYPLPFEPGFLARSRAHLLAGGDVHRPAAALSPGWPAVFGPTPVGQVHTRPRLALADWLANPRHPLTARVWVNRLWGWHFGRGIVATPSDFGVKGARPSHPELLDWLAGEFLRAGGSTKHVHRLIVLSNAYRRSSAGHPGNARIDPDNVSLWRWSPRRLEAEALRDATLAVTGELNRTPGGPGDADEVRSRRRGLYLLQRRDHPGPLAGLFDAPVAAAESCPRRGVSTVALQSLYLLNSDFATARAKTLAARVRSTGSPPVASGGSQASRLCHEERQVETAFRLALARRPDAVERAAVRRLFAAEGEAALFLLCQALLNTNEFLYLE
jgi:hypothetical protein